MLVDELGAVDVEEGAGTGAGDDETGTEAGTDAGAGDDENASVPSLTSSMNIELVDDQPLPYIIPVSYTHLTLPTILLV